MYQYHYLYKSTNLINNKIYIGIHSTNNLSDNYFGSGHAFEKALRKYGKENFKKEILEWFDYRIEALNRELQIVNEEFIKRKDTYNLKFGGNQGILGYKHTEESKELMRQNNLGENNPRFGKKLSENHLKVLLESNKGHTDETKEKIRQSHLGKAGWNKGIPMKEETRLKLIETKRNHPQIISDETKDKLSKALKGRIITEEWKNKMKEAAKRRYENPEERLKSSEVAKKRKKRLVTSYC